MGSRIYWNGLVIELLRFSEIEGFSRRAVHGPLENSRIPARTLWAFPQFPPMLGGVETGNGASLPNLPFLLKRCNF